MCVCVCVGGGVGCVGGSVCGGCVCVGCVLGVGVGACAGCVGVCEIEQSL